MIPSTGACLQCKNHIEDKNAYSVFGIDGIFCSSLCVKKYTHNPLRRAWWWFKSLQTLPYVTMPLKD